MKTNELSPELLAELEREAEKTLQEHYPNNYQKGNVITDAMIELSLSVTAAKIHHAHLSQRIADLEKQLEGRWISVNNPPPQKDDNQNCSDTVLVVIGETIFDGHYYYGSKKWNDDRIKMWQPLPPIPSPITKEKGENEL